MKKYFIAASLLFSLVIGSAFVIQDGKDNSGKPLTQEWFRFIGAPGEENDPSKYQLLTSEPNDCDEGPKRCAVYGQRQTGSNPVVPNLSQYHEIFTKQ